jgi:hypothetical protein
VIICTLDRRVLHSVLPFDELEEEARKEKTTVLGKLRVYGK